MQLELKKSEFDSLKAEYERRIRAGDYNVEILKTQIENINTEISLVQKQNDKQKKKIEILRSQAERTGVDLDHYRKQAMANLSAKKPTK